MMPHEGEQATDPITRIRQQKRQPQLPSSGWAVPAYFLRPTRANLLRNFSTRPPSESMLFCVPV